ncbi:nitrate reductase molybdenum cofactor assembly chaperone [Spirillospora sp. NPDC029432]|uniref:nitrate reductase molybdenum cofactor assembly chaperone n=1 Tax=Spirillospora sp. NPDC029432 TaxID=3154599 RepID=UPI00345283D9
MDFVVWRAASLLLMYPDQRFYDRRPMLRAAVADLPDGAARRCLDAFLDHVDRTPPIRMVVHYLEICREGRLLLTKYDDEARRRSVRERLAALYEAAGCDFEDEAEDSLPSLLEYAALCADDWPLREHRAALELLHETLESAGTPYAVPVAAVRATLAPPVPPAPAPATSAASARRPARVRGHDEGRRIINV